MDNMNQNTSIQKKDGNPNLFKRIQELCDNTYYEQLNWNGSFQDYLDIVKKNPAVMRTAFQRIYDMILSHGVSEYEENKEKILHYKFFDDPLHGGRDAVYGLDRSLMKLTPFV